MDSHSIAIAGVLMASTLALHGQQQPPPLPLVRPAQAVQDPVKHPTPCPLSKSAAVELINRAERLRQSGFYAVARGLLEKARPCVPEGHAAYAALSNNLAQIYKITGPKREVEKLLRAAVNAWLGSAYYAHGLANLGDWYQSRKDWRRAELMLQEAVALQPDVAIHHNNLGWLLHRRGHLDQAEHHYRRALELYEGTGQIAAMQAWGNLGMLLAQRKRDEEAMAAFQRMRGVSPVPADEKAQANYLEMYADLLRRRQDSAEAERVSAEAMRYRVRTAIRMSAVAGEPSEEWSRALRPEYSVVKERAAKSAGQ